LSVGSFEVGLPGLNSGETTTGTPGDWLEKIAEVHGAALKK